MSRFEKTSEDSDPLVMALNDVPVPAGLEARLLAAISASTTASVDTAASENLSNNGAEMVGELVAKANVEAANASQGTWSRRRWLSLGVSAGIGSVLAGGAYAWSRRPLTPIELVTAVNGSLGDADWVEWSSLPVEGKAASVPFPATLRRASLWQRRRKLSNSVAYNMSLPGCPRAVLFAFQTIRGLAAFPASPPPAPQHRQTGTWSHIATWCGADSGSLYVLAIQSDDVHIKRDYYRLFRTAPAVSLA